MYSAPKKYLYDMRISSIAIQRSSMNILDNISIEYPAWCPSLCMSLWRSLHETPRSRRNSGSAPAPRGGLLGCRPAPKLFMPFFPTSITDCWCRSMIQYSWYHFTTYLSGKIPWICWYIKMKICQVTVQVRLLECRETCWSWLVLPAMLAEEEALQNWKSWSLKMLGRILCPDYVGFTAADFSY